MTGRMYSMEEEAWRKKRVENAMNAYICLFLTKDKCQKRRMRVLMRWTKETRVFFGVEQRRGALRSPSAT
jgi:hypothetical protein